MTAELVHDEDWLRRAWMAANPGVTPTPWDAPLPHPRLRLVPAPAEAPVDLAAYRQQRHPTPEGA